MGASDELARKRRLIIDYETAFARTIAARVVEKPAMSVWMVLLPILLIHYFYRLQKFRAGAEAFAAHYMEPRLKALDTAAGHQLPATPPSSLRAPSKEAANRLYDASRTYISIVAAHYRRLLDASGDDYPSLVHSAYGDADEFERYILDSIEACSAINDVVLDITDPAEGFGDIVRRMETAMRDLHRHDFNRLFPR